jgi:hypothetical protein
MSRYYLSLYHARFGLWLIRTGRRITNRGLAITEFEIAKWQAPERYMTESVEAAADAGFAEIDAIALKKNAA